MIGAVVASTITILVEARKQKREVRLNLVSELTIIGYDILASLQELQTVKESGESILARSSPSYLTRRIGDLIALQTRYWLFFPKRKPRMVFNHFITRCDTVKKYLLEETRTSQEANTAISWLTHGLEELIRVAKNEAGFPFREPSKLYFVGFRKVTPEDERLLSPEDEAPPWEFNFSLQFHTEDLLLINKVTRNVESKVKYLKCSIHNRPAHIVFSGTKNNFDIQIEACCPEFAELVYKAITIRNGNDLSLKNIHYKKQININKR